MSDIEVLSQEGEGSFEELSLENEKLDSEISHSGAMAHGGSEEFMGNHATEEVCHDVSVENDDKLRICNDDAEPTYDNIDDARLATSKKQNRRWTDKMVSASKTDRQKNSFVTTSNPSETVLTENITSLAQAENSFEDEFDATFPDYPQSVPPKKRKNQQTFLSKLDMNTLEQLDADYVRALEDRDIGWNARHESVRQNAGFSLIFMMIYFTLGTLYISTSADQLTLGENLLFSVYSIATVGYGNFTIPKTPGFQIFMIFYILIGVATLTIMVAQVYQYIVLEAARAQFEKNRKREFAGSQEIRNKDASNISSILSRHDDDLERTDFAPVPFQFSSDSNHGSHFQSTIKVGQAALALTKTIKRFLQYNEVGQVIAVMSPFFGLTFIGALVVGVIERWTFVESVYFAVVSLTTVGYGDYHPTRPGSIWFCVLWLPFSVGFMSLYLGFVAQTYLQLSNRNVKRIERKKRRKLKRLKMMREKELCDARRRALLAAGIEDSNKKDDTDQTVQKHDSPSQKFGKNISRRQNANGFVILSELNDDSDDDNANNVFGITEAEDMEDKAEKRRRRIIRNSSVDGQPNQGTYQNDADEGLQSMREMIEAVRYNANNASLENTIHSNGSGNSNLAINSTSFLSLKPLEKIEMGMETRKKPTFALRVLVQERLADIIAIDIAGYQSSIKINDSTLSITIDKLNKTAKKWKIPLRGRKAFRAVAFEALYFVGERNLVIRGSDALFDLTPLEFHKLFAPLVASMGDFDDMNDWLACTEALAEADLHQDALKYSFLIPSSSRDLDSKPSSNSLERRNSEDHFDCHTLI